MNIHDISALILTNNRLLQIIIHPKNKSIMKKMIYVSLLLLWSTSGYIQGQRIESTLNGVTVYTDNGAYIKAKNTNATTYKCEFIYTERYTKDGKTVDADSNYSFSIAGNEERQLLYSSIGVVKITMTKSGPEDSDENQAPSNSSGSGRRRTAN
jgi:hypothetical protein